MSDSPILSPCIGKCALNEAQICRGCFRSLEEIRQWRTMNEAEQIATIDRCQQRKRQRRLRISH